MSDPVAAAIDSPLAAPGTSAAQARGTPDRGLDGNEPAARPIERLEMYPEESPRWVRMLLKGGGHHAVSWVGAPYDAAALPAGSYQGRLTPTRWELTWTGDARQGPKRPVVFTELRLLREQARSIEATAGLVACLVVRSRPESQGAPAPAPAAPNLAFAVRPDPAALARSQELRDFVWLLLQHFFEAPAIRGRSVTMLDIDTLAAGRPAVSAALARVTQAWAELQRTREPSLARLRPLAELIVEQYVFGNDTIVLNTLGIRDQPLGLGLYHRVNGLKYYDERGLPALDVTQANRRDVFYAATARPVFEYAPQTRDWATAKLLQMIAFDPEIVAVVEGLMTNIDLFARHVRRPELEKVFKSMWKQVGALLIFLGAEGVIVLLEKLGTAREKLVAMLLHAALVVTGRLFQIRFVDGLRETLLAIGHHLYRVRRLPDGTLDDLSRQHLDSAAEITRPLLEEIAGLALAVGGLKVAAATAPLIKPPGGPSSMMFVPATAAASGRSGGLAAPGAGAGEVAALPPNVLVVTGTGNRPPAAEAAKEEEEPRESRTPRELEEDLLGPDSRPDTPFYLSRVNRALRTTLKALIEHLANAKNKQYYKPEGKTPIDVRPEKIDVETIEFLQKPGNEALLKWYWELVTEAQKDVRFSRASAYKVSAQDLERGYSALLQFGKGKLGSKRPDKLEFFIDRGEFATTDTSFAWYTEFHNFKHAVYVAAIKEATGLKGAGLEFESFPKSRLIEVETKPDTPPGEEPPPESK